VYTREGLDSVNVIPSDLYEELSTNDDLIKKSKHEVAVRKSRVLSGEIRKDKQGFEYLTCEYDFDTGLKFIQRKASDPEGNRAMSC